MEHNWTIEILSATLPLLNVSISYPLLYFTFYINILYTLVYNLLSHTCSESAMQYNCPIQDPVLHTCTIRVVVKELLDSIVGC